MPWSSVGWRRSRPPWSRSARGDGPATDRLKGWLLALFHAKVRKVTADPEMFAAYHAITKETHEVTARHLAAITGQVEAIVASGIASGEFPPTDPQRAARTLLNASAPLPPPRPPGPTRATVPTVEEAEDVFALLIAGTKGWGLVKLGRIVVGFILDRSSADRRP